MLNIKTWHAAVVTIGVGLASATFGFGQPRTAPMPAVLRDYQPVTAQRLKDPEDGNWLMIRRTYDGWGYSPLDAITPDSIQRLRPVWAFATGETRVHESAPIVN